LFLPVYLSLEINSFDSLVLSKKLFSSLSSRLFSSCRSRKRSRGAARSFSLLASTGNAGTNHGSKKFHFFRIRRSRAIFRFIAAEPLPAFLLDFFRRRGVLAFAFFFRDRRRVPPLLLPGLKNTACCAGVSCANPAKPPGGGYLIISISS
jgi:hypothetical protein